MAEQRQHYHTVQNRWFNLLSANRARYLQNTHPGEELLDFLKVQWKNSNLKFGNSFWLFFLQTHATQKNREEVKWDRKGCTSNALVASRVESGGSRLGLRGGNTEGLVWKFNTEGRTVSGFRPVTVYGNWFCENILGLRRNLCVNTRKLDLF